MIALIAAALALACCAALGLSARRLATVLPAAVATPVIVVSALAASASAGFSLASLALVAVAQLAPVAGAGGWDPVALQRGSDVPPAAGVAVALLVVLALSSGLALLVEQAHALTRAVGEVRPLASTDDGFSIVDDAAPRAFAVGAGDSGRVVLSTGLIRGLDVQDRRAVLEHEFAHLRHHHVLWVAAARLAARTNPLLRNVPGAVRYAVERWADEDAGRALGSRPAVAAALARAALMSAGQQVQGALAMTTTDVPDRVRQLLDPPRPLRRALVVAVCAVGFLGLVVAVVTGTATHDLFEHAELVATR
ncbi:M56 family metallopeptidase [Angustibacter sp. McL0619]|uniref:M56 family metallopeptidase n=1 Tax=Angustibacter sp. McL0619 TaxID=3415676 RepID=UPI003CF74C03